MGMITRRCSLKNTENFFTFRNRSRSLQGAYMFHRLFCKNLATAIHCLQESCKTVCKNNALTCKILQDILQNFSKIYIYRLYTIYITPSAFGFKMCTGTLPTSFLRVVLFATSATLRIGLLLSFVALLGFFLFLFFKVFHSP